MKYDYPFTNSIVFSLVMRDVNLCRGLLQLIFPDREIRDVRLHQDFADTEKTLIVGIDSRQVRLDVLFTDESAWYDVEMQVRSEDDIPQRARYYHGIIDVDTLDRGEEYNTLKPSYVIFLCCFDFFGGDKPVYRFSAMEEENHLPLGDEAYTIILNSRASGTVPVPEPLRQLFQYMNEDIVSEENDLIRQIDQSVEIWNSGEGRRRVMTLEQEILIRENRAEKKGREEGLKEGRIETLYALVQDGLLPIEEAAKRAEMTTEEFSKKTGASVSAG